MTSELKIQNQIMDDARKLRTDVFAMKMSHHFMSGIPDLIIKVPGYDVILVEVKRGEMGIDGMVKVNTTALQRQTMKVMEESGLRVEVWVAIEDEKEMCMLRTVPEATRVVCRLDRLPHRKRGIGWQIEDFLNNPVRN
jgi:hypothetical protein